MEEAKYARLSEKAKSILLIELIKEQVGLSIAENGTIGLRSPMTRNIVEKLASTVIEMWPRNMPPGSPNYGPQQFAFQLLYWGSRTPNSVAAYVGRMSLYADRILIANPFVDVMLHHPNYSPLIQPEAWTGAYASAALYLVLLDEWIRSDSVALVVSPGCFDCELARELANDARKNLAELPEFEHEAMAREFMPELLAEIICQTPLEQRAGLLEFITRDDTPAKREELQALVNDVLLRDPQRASLKISKFESSQLVRVGSGLTYEQARLLASVHGACILADEVGHGRLLRLHTSEYLSPFQRAAKALASLEFQFLNNVPAEFVLEVKAAGRLSRFRRFLCDLATNSESCALRPDALELQLSQFVDRLEDEYSNYKSDWQSIQKKLAAKSVLEATLIAGAAAAPMIASGKLSGLGLFPMLSAVLAMQTNSLIETYFGRKAIERQPLGLLLSLERLSSK